MNAVVAVFIGGGLGSLSRFAIGRFFSTLIPSEFPLGTFVSNVLSCAVLALVLSVFSQKILADSTLRLFILTGFCGGFSTFSTFSNETLELMRNGNFLLAVINIVLNIVVCFATIYFITKLN